MEIFRGGLWKYSEVGDEDIQGYVMEIFKIR